MCLETEQAASLLSKWINDQGAEEQANRDADGDLDHTITNVKNDAAEIVRS